MTVGVDEDTKKLCRDMRFAIDFENIVEPDIYKLSNRKMALNNYEYFNRGATMILTLSYDAFNRSTDKLVEFSEGKKVWICNYTSTTPLPPKEDETAKIEISYNGKPELKVGGNYKTFTASKIGIDTSNRKELIGTWEVISIPEMETIIKYLISDNIIRLKIENDEFAIGNKIRIKFTEKSTMVATHLDIDIVNSF